MDINFQPLKYNILLDLLVLIQTFLPVNLYCNCGNHPNILLFIVDDLRPALGCYGDSLAFTPNIDRIANEGILFTKAFAQQALCGPSRTSFLTSRRPDTTCLVDVHYYWRKHAGNFTTLPQYFKEHGYITQSVGKVFHPGITSNKKDDQPFSWSQTPYHPSSQKYKNAPVCLSKDGKLHSNIYCPVEVKKQPERTLPDIQSTEFALRWLKRRAERQRPSVNCAQDSTDQTCDDSKPFFLAVGFHKPHIPLKFPMEFLELYPIDSVPLPPNCHLPPGLPFVAWNPWNDLRWRDDIVALNLSFPFGPMPDFYSKYIRQGYYAATSYTDSLIGLIISLTQKLFPNTIIAFIGDHGWSLGEHQEWSKFSNFDVATRVPFIVSVTPDKRVTTSLERSILRDTLSTRVASRYFKSYVKARKSTYNSIRRRERSKRARKYDGVVELIDLFPTLVDLAGLPALQTCPSDSHNVTTCADGISLACIIDAKLNGRAFDAGQMINALCPYKKIVLSQYPRPSVYPSKNPDSDQPRLTESKIMGYSLRTSRFRYTAWLKFNHSTFKVDFDDIYGEELYDHKYDCGETDNILANRQKEALYFKNYLKMYILS